MNFLVDIGNSRIKWVCQVSGQLSGHGSKFYKKEENINFFDELWENMPVPKRLLVANVGGGHIAEQLHQWSVNHWHIVPEFVSVTGQAYGVTNAYSDVNKLGIDRWMALIAVWHKYHSAACIVDCGSAVTIDALNTEGEHLGGLILPGIMLMQQSLSQKTMLEVNNKNETIEILADATEPAIRSGCILAIVGLIEHVLKELQKSPGGKLCCILAGGDAEKIKNHLPGEFIHDPHIVLEGLSIVAGGNL